MRAFSAQEKGFEPLRRYCRPTGVRSQTLQPLGYSCFYHIFIIIKAITTAVNILMTDFPVFVVRILRNTFGRMKKELPLFLVLEKKIDYNIYSSILKLQEWEGIFHEKNRNADQRGRLPGFERCNERCGKGIEQQSERPGSIWIF